MLERAAAIHFNSDEVFPWRDDVGLPDWRDTTRRKSDGSREDGTGKSRIVSGLAYRSMRRGSEMSAA